MTVLADFPENGIYLDTDDEPSARLCRVVRGVLQEEYERLWLVERVFSENDDLTKSLSNNLAAERPSLMSKRPLRPQFRPKR